VPAGDAVRRASPTAPLVISVHGHDVHGRDAGTPAVRGALGHARLVLANSGGTARRSAAAGARASRIVHLGADLPPTAATPPSVPTLVTVGNLVPRKRHADVIDALAIVRERHSDVRYVVVGDGPERKRLAARAAARRVSDAVEFRGALPHAQAVAAAQTASLFVLPSVEEAFGVAYIEAMAGGTPAIGCLGEDGPAEIAAAGDGIELVPSRDPEALAERIIGLLDADPDASSSLRAAARATVSRAFTWEGCGRTTLEAYEAALAGGQP
jgi:glycosyltransferase involved in cell wall biosynthesis